MPAGLAVIGIGTAIGGMIYGYNSYSDKARQLQGAANAAAQRRDQYYKEMTELAKKQYERWEQDFGEIQTEVAEYYKNLDDSILKEQYENANIEANQSLVKQYFQAQQQLNANINKAGMSGSGADISSSLQLQQSMLQQKASNRWQTEQLKANANNVLMGQKQQWTAQGENLRSQAMQNQFNAEQIKGNDAAAQHLQYQQQSYNADMAAINTLSSGLANIGGTMLGIGGQMYTANLDRNTSLDIAKIKYGITSPTQTIPYGVSTPNFIQRSINNYNWVDDYFHKYPFQSKNMDTFRNSNVKTTQLYNSNWR